MHDPKTVAFEIRRPWRDKTATWGDYFPPLVTIWHVDPEIDGSDDSCGWFRPPLTKKEREWAKEIVTNPDDNIAHWFTGQGDDEKVHQLSLTIRNFRRFNRRWWQHPKWHFWHWEFQIHALQHFLRWAFGRCIVCGRRFSWGYSPMAGWNSDGPRWFRSERIWHHECDQAPPR